MRQMLRTGTNRNLGSQTETGYLIELQTGESAHARGFAFFYPGEGAQAGSGVGSGPGGILITSF